MDQRAFLRIFEQAIRPIKQRIMMAVARGILESVKDDGGVQLVKVSLLKDEVRENLERFQNFGFTSNPPKDSEVVAVFVGGNREHGFVVACDNRASRKKSLEPGEAAVYTDDGTYIILKKGGKVEVKAATSLTIDVPNSTFTGAVKIQGNLEVQRNLTVDGNANVDGEVDVGGQVVALDVVGGGTSMSALHTAHNAHVHNIVTPVPGNPTTPAVPPL